ncbi:MAG: DUF1844 domain-containing protein [Planctomycetota bacterium]|nr:DUF1844 domain-containing protein [Planctomycetota bacterium]MDA1140613.1 DUF1844 domain-containing protein [Planctomycetota bacterium]
MPDVTRNLKAEPKTTADCKADKPPIPEPSLQHLIMSFATQALFGLGEAENPATSKKEQDLDWAKFNIDMLEMLEEKTRDNTSAEEKNLFVQILYDLRMRYIKAVG